MDNIISDIVNLNNEFGKSVRICEIDGSQYFSVHDILQLTTDTNSPYQLWARIKSDDAGGEFDGVIKEYKFDGQGSRHTPVADVETILKIIFLMRGTMAAKFRKHGVWLLLNFINPSQEFVNKIKEAYDSPEESLPNNEFLIDANKTGRISKRAYQKTHLYVRIQLPDTYIITNSSSMTSSMKRMTKSIIKFGITYCLSNRNNQYIRENDNGFFAFEFTFNQRCDAEIVEDILKNDFYDIAIANSKEYVDTIGLAAKLGIDSFSTDSYEQYTNLAWKLHAYIVEKAKAIWPLKYGDPANNGCVYNVVEKMQSNTSEMMDVEIGYVQRSVTSSELGARKTPVEVYLAKQLIDMQFKYTGEPVVSEQSNEINTPIPEQTNETNIVPIVATVSVIQTIDKNKSNGPVIARDIVTGIETTYPNLAHGARANVGFSAKCISKTFLDKPRQYGGFHWRTPNTHFWIPPSGFTFDPEIHEIVTVDRYIKSTNVADGTVQIYESITAGGRFNSIAARTLSDHIDDNVPFEGKIWTSLSIGSCGHMVSSSEGIDSPVIHVVKADKSFSGRSNGQIIMRNLLTGDETTYTSQAKAAAYNNLTPHTLRDTYIDKPYQAYGKHFRTTLATKAWVPPTYYKYDATAFYKKAHLKDDGYIVSTLLDGTDKIMYDCRKAASQIENIHISSITQFVNTGKPSGNRVWRYATPDEYETWTDL